MAGGDARAAVRAAPAKSRHQLSIYAALLGAYALLVFGTYVLFPLDMLAPGASASPASQLSGWQLGLINAAVVTLLYGLLGLAGYWLARRLGLPGILRDGATPREWGLVPLAIGAAAGVALIAADRLFASSGDWPGFAHPAFPLSIFASGAAGIGEEVLFRLIVLSLWASILNLGLGRIGAGEVAFWVGNAIAALAFAAGHLPAVVVLLDAPSPADLPAIALAEVFVLNGVVGLICGWQFRRVGLVGAVGVHFWADVVWHVIFPLSGV